jgi:hypothetical protein
MGEGFKFYLKEPVIQAGKVFSPSVESTVRFIPAESFDLITDYEYKSMVRSIAIIQKART